MLHILFGAFALGEGGRRLAPPCVVDANELKPNRVI
jgi:hypothetical protein